MISDDRQPESGRRQPVQARSRRTMDRIVRAAEELLEERPFDAVSVAEIVHRAGTSVGAFYARFSCKGDLLAAIYARRFGAEAAERSKRYLADFAAREMPLELRAREVVRNMATYFESNRRLLQAMALRAGQRKETPPAESREIRAHRAVFNDGWARAFLTHRDQIGHPEPERAVRFGLFVAAAACRDAFLLGEPRGESLPAEDLVSELGRALHAYLTGG
ncbi:MAG: helix-turn-helix domain containing protein [Gemmatimonadales bacterium]|jgi:AcrR family transcriptional regulator